MSSWHFQDPWYLLLALLVYVGCVRCGGYLTYSSERLVQELPVSRRARCRNRPSYSLGLNAIGLAVALARPRSPNAQSRVRREGIALMTAVD